ncbi:MAG TPA: aromatic ring-hydroxylating dioxygenase subunit alpha [Stellaceae bacterium]|nr:aromatic ring-hydroxylating dioxygenase subunit alpha [Stellaceae bacterium]
MFLKDTWQVAAYGVEVGQSLLARRLCGEDVVLYRTADGSVHALRDACPHRSVPLSLGKLVGDIVQCGYHGLCFDTEGTCVNVPGQDRIPQAAKARVYPAVERYSFVWIWLGDPALADEAKVPNFFWMTSPDWAISEGYHHVEADYRLLNDNLLDLSHETFVHAHTIGNAAVADSPLAVKIEGDTVRAHRDMMDCEPPPFYVRATGFKTNIDRWHTTIYTPPGFHVIENGSMPAGSDKEEARAKGMTRERRVLNLITPESETSSHYFWAIARCYDLEDAELTDYIRREVSRTFDEDKHLLEAQQRRLTTQHGDGAFVVALRADAGAIQGRKVLETMLNDQEVRTAAQ